MTRISLLRRRILAIGFTGLIGSGLAGAQSPDKPLRIILPVGAGSGVDTITRSVGPALSKEVGRAVVIENLPGAGGITGTAALVKSPADGLTISVVSNNHVINPSVYARMPFDSLEDITPIAVIGTTPIVLVVNPSKVPVKNVQEFVAFLKAKPGAYNYASSGNGTILHLAAEMFVGEAQVQVRHIPYKGVGPMVVDLIGGQVEWGMLALPSVQGHLKNGTLRAIGVGGLTRVAAAPDLPTIAEQGLPNYDSEGWFAVIGPARLPAAQIKRIHAAFSAAFATPEVQDAMSKQGNAINLGTPEAAVQFFRTETAKYARLVKLAGVKID
ncbi:MAG: tripartite tricarboxylate transporter substrate binding protein [Betaproteobacteria bacterium]|nr:tripartite tricarboxylate transporter substrate binding protein [Betaproteobacteria bacterium]